MMRIRTIHLTVLTTALLWQSVVPCQLSCAQTQTKPRPQNKTKVKSAETESPEQARQQLITRIGDVLRATAESSKQWKDVLAATNVQAQVADLIWESDAEAGRTYLTLAWTTAGKVKEPEQERSRFRNESVRNDARRGVMIVARKRAPDLMQKWLEQMAEETDNEQDKSPRGVFDDRTSRSTVLLQMAMQSVGDSPQTASQLAIESLRDGISFGLQDVLIKIQEKDVDLAQTVFRAALARLKMAGLLDPNELLILYSYLYTPGRITAANTNDNPGNRQLAVSMNRPRIDAAAHLNPGLALEFLNLAADLLVDAPLPATATDPQAAARAQLSAIYALMSELSRQLPEKASALQRRAQQIDIDARFSTVPPPPRSDIPKPVAGESREEYANRRVDFLADAAEKESDPLRRDIAYAKAALSTTVEQYKRGLELSGKVKDKQLNDGVTEWLIYRAVLNFIKSGDFESAYELNLKNSDPVQRAACLVLGAQRLVETKNIIRARQWLEEARTLIRKAEPDENRPRVALGVVSVYGQFDDSLTIESLSEAAKLMNQSPTAFSNDERAPLAKRFSGIEPLSDFTYGTTGFSLAAALRVFAPNQFEDALYAINTIKSPEVRGTATVTLCQQYLHGKLDNRTKPSQTATQNLK